MTCRYCHSNMDRTELPPLYCASHPESRVCPRCYACQQEAPVFGSQWKLERMKQLVEDFT